MNDREKLEVLRKRASHLRLRIADSVTRGKRLTFDEAEVAALEWAIQIVEDHMKRKESR